MTVCFLSFYFIVDPWAHAFRSKSKHQAETILQLRQEARQWKDQCLRLEETARREALDWKEQFLRVEEERRDLLSRIDELVAEKLAVRISTSPHLHYITYVVLLVPQSATDWNHILHTKPQIPGDWRTLYLHETSLNLF